jgi:hypothetical protein
MAFLVRTYKSAEEKLIKTYLYFDRPSTCDLRWGDHNNQVLTIFLLPLLTLAFSLSAFSLTLIFLSANFLSAIFCLRKLNIKTIQLLC